MIVPAVSVRSFVGAASAVASYARQPSPAPASSADSVSISPAAYELLAARGTPSAPVGGVSTAAFDTNRGEMTLDIDAYFTPPGSQGVDLDSVPLLMPSQKNVEALVRHISTNMRGFLSANGIPAAPASIRYDNAGQLQLPADYPYAEAFEQALADNPVMARELSTVAALSSSLVEMNKSLAFHTEYAAATSSAEVNAVIAKYSHLFANNRHVDSIALNFTGEGVLSITHDGKSLAES